eukprot:2264088-Amphidinium_carterae.1
MGLEPQVTLHMLHLLLRSNAQHMWAKGLSGDVHVRGLAYCYNTLQHQHTTSQVAMPIKSTRTLTQLLPTDH